MTESLVHIDLVKKLREYTLKLVPSENYDFIFEDSAIAKEIPPIIMEKYRPDLYYEYENQLIVGEAKTEKDIRSEHSKEQYISFIKYCSEYKGNALLLFAVPWTELGHINCLLRKIAKESNYYCSIKVISNLD